VRSIPKLSHRWHHRSRALVGPAHAQTTGAPARQSIPRPPAQKPARRLRVGRARRLTRRFRSGRGRTHAPRVAVSVPYAVENRRLRNRPTAISIEFVSDGPHPARRAARASEDHRSLGPDLARCAGLPPIYAGGPRKGWSVRSRIRTSRANRTNLYRLHCTRSERSDAGAATGRRADVARARLSVRFNQARGREGAPQRRRHRRQD
jgi:hypothetical protein